MLSEGQEAVILFYMTTGTSSNEAARTFVSKTGAQVIKAEAIQVNTLPSNRVLSDIQTQKGVIRAMSYFIQREKQIFVFHGLTSPGLYQKYGSIFEKTMRAFKELSDAKKIGVKPDRIRIHTIRRTDTLENALRSFGVPNGEMKEAALLNGKNLNDTIPANTLIKVVEKGR